MKFHNRLDYLLDLVTIDLRLRLEDAVISKHPCEEIMD